MYQAHFEVAYGEHSVVRVRPAVVAVPVHHVHIAADALQPVICLLRIAQKNQRQSGLHAGVRCRLQLRYACECKDAIMVEYEKTMVLQIESSRAGPHSCVEIASAEYLRSPAGKSVSGSLAQTSRQTITTSAQRWY